MNYNTDMTSLFGPNKFDKISPDQVNQLLRRKQPTQSEIEPFDGEGVAELEAFCKKHGILAANFGNMNPRAALKMLKSRLGQPITEQASRGLLKG